MWKVNDGQTTDDGQRMITRALKCQIDEFIHGRCAFTHWLELGALKRNGCRIIRFEDGRG